MIRLQKFLAQSGVASRRKAEELISEGRVRVNDEIEANLGTKVDEKNDQVFVNGKRVRLVEEKIYLALNKPLGYICSATSKQGKSVLELAKTKARLFPVGRLDKDSSGLLLLTNDGDFANQLTHPRYSCAKEYFVTTDRQLKPEHIKRLKQGLILDGQRVAGVEVKNIKTDSAILVLHQGMNRQIRRSLGQLGYTVIKLKRIKIGKLSLGDLPLGKTKPVKITDVL